MELTKFKDLVKEWLTFLEIEKNFSVHTIDAYTSDLEQLIKFWEKAQKDEPKIEHSFDTIIRRFVVSLFYKKSSKSTLARKISCLRSFRDFLSGMGIKFSLDVKAPRRDKKLPVILSVDEIFYLLDSIKPQDLPTKFPYRDKAIFELLYATGMRCGELVGVKLSNIDFNEKAIKVFGKGKKERIVLYGSKAQDAIKNYVALERANCLKEQGADHEYLFLNSRGERIGQRSVQRILEMFRKLLKINRNLTPHKLRHSFATHLLNQGVDLRVIKELLGHKTLATTEIYTYVSSSDLARMCDDKHPLNKIKS